MVKGVNKAVIEIVDTGNKYFNKVILFVSPEYSSKDRKKINEEADKMVKKLRTSSSTSLRKAVLRERKRRKLLITSFLLAGAIALAVLIWAIL